MLSGVFRCLKCGRCCLDSLFIPLTFEDVYSWYLSKCFLPIVFIIRESNDFTQEAEIEWAYTLLSHRHSIYMTIRTIFRKYGIKISDRGCSMFNDRDNYCRIYRLRPLACRLFPFDSSLRLVSWALDNCEAVKRGFKRPPQDYSYIANRYSRSVELTYSNPVILSRIENIRRIVFEKTVTAIVKDRYDIETLRYLLFKVVEYG